MSHWTIKKRFVWGVIILTLIVAVTGGLGYAGLRLSVTQASTINRQIKEHGRFLAQSINLARTAQVDFKKQVQEWKDILLRGNEPEMFEKHLGLFQERQADVDQDLKLLHQLFVDAGVDTRLVDQSLVEHEKLAGMYREALKSYHTNDASSGFVVDRQIRGIDRSATDAIDAIVRQVQQFEADTTRSLEAYFQQENGRNQAAMLLWALAGVTFAFGFGGVLVHSFAGQLFGLAKNVFDATTEVAIISMGKDGLVTLFNSGAERMLGYSAAEIVGKEMPVRWHRSEKVTAQAAQPGGAVGTSQCGFEVFADMAQEGHGHTDEWTLVRRDGGLVEVNLAVTAVRDARRELIGYLMVASDITERKQAQRELQKREEHFRLLIENAADLITVINYQGELQYLSPSVRRLLGCAAEELMGRNVFELVHPEDVARVHEAIGVAIKAAGTQVSVEYRARHQDGKWRIHQSVGCSAAGQAADGFIVLNTRDVTENRQLEEQFRQSQKMEAIGQLAGGVAHDFNNILGAILMQVELTRRWANDAAQVQNGLLRVHEDAKRAAALTRQLLFFSRRQVMQPRNVNLNEIINQTTALLRRIIGEDVRLELKLSSSPLQTRVDSGMIDQVLMNLAVNARDAMPEGGELRIETSEQVVDEETARHHIGATAGRFVSLSVSDTGGGIPAEVLPRIFEPFFTTKEVGKGTGLGLATVTGIVQQHGGWIKVESEPGKGTCFQVFLPAHAYEVAKTETVQTDFRARRLGGGETILLVEDEPGVRTPMRRLIEKSGYRVLEAPDGVEALRIWKSQRENVSLLITDLVMPGGISGKQLAKSMVADKPELKVIYSSGYSVDLASRQMALHDGEILLQKPFTPNQLLETIRNCLDGSGSALCDSSLVGSGN